MANLHALLVSLVLISAYAFAVTEDNALDEDPRPKLRKIHSLSDKCLESTCYGFQYPDIDEVAFFDLITEVHINDGESSYDIVNPPSYQTLIFVNSSFARFPLNLFYSVATKELDMRNCSVQLVTWESFIMAKELQILLLSNNQLQKIDEMTFNYAEGLKYLFLDGNRLSTLVSESFKGLNQLNLLDLRHNQLEQLPPGLFDYLPSLQELQLDNNRLHTINDGLFLTNAGLYMVTLSRNRLREIGDYVLNTQNNLVLLDLSHNSELKSLVLNIRTQHLIARNCSLRRVNIYGAVQNADMSGNRIVELYFSQPENLRVLNLRNNSLEQIASLTRATHLLALDLGDNPDMNELPAPWLAKALERLDLANTGLKQLPINVLAEQPSLRFLNVSDNQLGDINPMNFKYLEKLTHFDIHANDWNCYSLRRIMDMLIKPHKITYVRDTYDEEYPGEYINGIACMYRIEQADESTSVEEQMVNVVREDKANLRAMQGDESKEVEDLRKEFKAVVQFFEEKFDKAFALIENLNNRLAEFERMNATYWQDVTITV